MKLWDRIKLFFGVRRDMRRLINENRDALNNISPDTNRLDIDIKAFSEAADRDAKLAFMKDIAKSDPEQFSPKGSLIYKIRNMEMVNITRCDENSTGHDSPEK